MVRALTVVFLGTVVLLGGRRQDPDAAPSGGPVPRRRAVDPLADRYGWHGLRLAVGRFVAGIAGFVLVVLLLGLSAGLLVGPLVYDLSPATYGVGPWVVDTLFEALVAAALGAAVLVVSLTALNAVAPALGAFVRRERPSSPPAEH